MGLESINTRFTYFKGKEKKQSDGDDGALLKE